MFERVEVEVGPELAVQHGEHVLVEPGGDARRVVVGGFDDRRVLDQVGPEHEPVVGPQQVRDAGQEGRPLRRLEVADRAPEEGDHPRAAERDPLQVALVVAHEPAHVDAVLAGNRLGRRPGDLLRDVDRCVRAEAAVVAQRVEQHASLRGRPGAELDQRRRGACRLADPRGVALEDRALRPRRVVLGQPRDLLEELRPAAVVEVARGELLERLREAGPDVRRHPRERPGRREVDVDGDVRCGRAAHVLLTRPRRPGFVSRCVRGRASDHRGSVSRPSRSECRRRSGAAPRGPSCGRWRGLRFASSPTSRLAGPGSRSRRRPRSTRGRGRRESLGRR